MNKKMEERIEEIDYIIMSAVCLDITSGVFLTEADDETLEMLLIGVWEDFDAFLAKGVILGNA